MPSLSQVLSKDEVLEEHHQDDEEEEAVKDWESFVDKSSQKVFQDPGLTQKQITTASFLVDIMHT